ncbi:MlaA family lipoprotein [Candidatus Thioglobus sp.]|uniref:MlaA family lipoprotein n=1 Tax=Candidatus Thioglobus sp. TaxID=2026721 RepID=UPI003D13A7F2
MKQLLIGLLLLFTNVVVADDVDPFEETNRAIYEFNEVVDDNLLEPVSRAYKNNVPKFAQNRVSDFFGNLRDISTLANQILQFKVTQSVTTLGRIVVNSTIGLYGLFDVASEIDLITDDEDFGQTMAVWGVGKGPYIMIPFLGPSTLRDGIGTYVDITSNANLINELDGSDALGANVANVVDRRVRLLPITDLLDQSDDAYTTIRSSYLQKRQFDIFDGKPPIEEDDEF